MNLLSKRLKLGALQASAAVSIIILSPGIAGAAVTTKESPFCTSLPATISKVDTSISSLEGKLTSARTQRDQQLASNRAKWDQDIAASRAKWDQQRQEAFTKLEAKAASDTQKAAVTAYETTITNAVKTRRSANDSARQTYRAAVTKTLADQRATVDGQAGTFTQAVHTAVTAAQASCAANPGSGGAIRTTLQAALKSARQAYTADRKADGGVGDQVKQLAQTRDNTIKANDAAFKTAANAARDTLKAAFGNKNV